MSFFDKTLNMYVAYDSIEVSCYDLEGSAESLKETVDNTVAKAKTMGMIVDGNFDISATRDYYDSYNIEVTYNFIRVENDKEREAREAAEAKVKEAAAEKRKMKKDAEYAEYKRLKAKFEADK